MKHLALLLFALCPLPAATAVESSPAAATLSLEAGFTNPHRSPSADMVAIREAFLNP